MEAPDSASKTHNLCWYHQITTMFKILNVLLFHWVDECFGMSSRSWKIGIALLWLGILSWSHKFCCCACSSHVRRLTSCTWSVSNPAATTWLVADHTPPHASKSHSKSSCYMLRYASASLSHQQFVPKKSARKTFRTWTHTRLVLEFPNATKDREICCGIEIALSGTRNSAYNMKTLNETLTREVIQGQNRSSIFLVLLCQSPCQVLATCMSPFVKRTHSNWHHTHLNGSSVTLHHSYRPK